MSSIYYRETNLNQKNIVIIFLIFLLPLLASFAVYFFSEEIGLKSKNFGTLLTTVVPLDSLNLRDLEGGPFLLDAIRGQWVLVYHPGAVCSEQCGQDLKALEKVRLALGKDYRRTDLLLLIAPSHSLVSGSVDNTVAVIDEISRQKLTAASGAGAKYSGPLLFLADVYGNVMMSYDPAIDQKSVYEDLRWLLKVNKSHTRDRLFLIEQPGELP